MNPWTLAGVSMCDKSAATPGVCTMSYRLNCVTSGLCFSSSDNGWPIPPDAPQTATLTLFYGEIKKKKQNIHNIKINQTRDQFRKKIEENYNSCLRNSWHLLRWGGNAEFGGSSHSFIYLWRGGKILSSLLGNSYRNSWEHFTLVIRFLLLIFIFKEFTQTHTSNQQKSVRTRATDNERAVLFSSLNSKIDDEVQIKSATTTPLDDLPRLIHSHTCKMIKYVDI